MSEAVAVPAGGEQLVFETMADLERHGAFKLCSLQLPEGTSLERYEAVGVVLGEVRRRISWYLGDWIIFGEGSYGERFAQVINATGMEQETLRAYAYVCSQIPEKRRKPQLAFGHHRLVAPLDPKEQTYWLDQAAKKNWTVTELRGAIQDKAAEGRDPLPGTEATPSSFKALVCEMIVRVRDSAVEDVSGQGMVIPKELFHRLVAFVEED